MDVIVGPVATANFELEIDQTTGQPGSGALVDSAFFTPPPPGGIGMQCSILDQFSYGQVKVTSSQAHDHAQEHRRQVAAGRRDAVRPVRPQLPALR